MDVTMRCRVETRSDVKTVKPCSAAQRERRATVFWSVASGKPRKRPRRSVFLASWMNSVSRIQYGQMAVTVMPRAATSAASARL